MALQVNHLLDQQGDPHRPGRPLLARPSEDEEAVTALTHDIMTLQAHGDYAGVKPLMDRMVVIRPEVQRVIDQLYDVPVDIAPKFVTAEELTAQ